MTMISSADHSAVRRGPGAGTRRAGGHPAIRPPATPAEPEKARPDRAQLHKARLDAARIDAAMAGFVTSVVSLATGVEAGKIVAATRHSASAARARHVAMYLAHIGLAWPLSRVGAAFGRDRTTASHAVQRVEDLRDEPGFDAVLDALEACVRAGPPPLVARGLAQCD